MTDKFFGGSSSGPTHKLPKGYTLCPDCAARIHVGNKPSGTKVGCPRCRKTFLLD